eukprot:m.190642 g.190642  ORF g.190642 m.190642 type:complete len:402 (+) comp18568_c0_seq2:161-1366(+)
MLKPGQPLLIMEMFLTVMFVMILRTNGLSLGSENIHLHAPNTTIISVFHVNQANYSVTDITNMNTANLHGDMYFALRSYALPQECGPLYNESFWSHLDCSDAEVDATNLAVTYLDIEVSLPYGPYADCNVADGDYSCSCAWQDNNCALYREDVACDSARGCQWTNDACYAYHCSNHTSPNSCTENYYEDCIWKMGNCVDNSSLPSGLCDERRVGRQNCSNWDEIYSIYSHHGERVSEVSCWHENMVHKVGGLWYSTRKEGQCTSDSQTLGVDCFWKVHGIRKRVEKTCVDASINKEVEMVGADCFGQCDQPHNTSSLCWIRCFFDTVLGPNSGNTTNATGGMPLADLENAWLKPFQPVSQGGCPSWPTSATPLTASAVPYARRLSLHSTEADRRNRLRHAP